MKMGTRLQNNKLQDQEIRHGDVNYRNGKRRVRKVGYSAYFANVNCEALKMQNVEGFDIICYVN